MSREWSKQKGVQTKTVINTECLFKHCLFCHEQHFVGNSQWGTTVVEQFLFLNCVSPTNGFLLILFVSHLRPTKGCVHQNRYQQRMLISKLFILQHATFVGVGDWGTHVGDICCSYTVSSQTKKKGVFLILFVSNNETTKKMCKPKSSSNTNACFKIVCSRTNNICWTKWGTHAGAHFCI